MIKFSPIQYSDGTEMIICPHCGFKQYKKKTITENDFFSLQLYLDDFRKGLENTYFNMLYQQCKNCSNFAPLLSYDITEKFNEDIIGVINSEISEDEKHLLISYMINNNTTSLLQLYWYYDINNNKKVVKYRKLLINQYVDIFNKQKDRHSLRMIIELLRREGSFDKALKYARKNMFLPKNDINKALDISNPYESQMIKQEILLCKEKNLNRELFRK